MGYSKTICLLKTGNISFHINQFFGTQQFCQFCQLQPITCFQHDYILLTANVIERHAIPKNVTYKIKANLTLL